jgi:hypothetical protein
MPWYSFFTTCFVNNQKKQVRWRRFVEQPKVTAPILSPDEEVFEDEDEVVFVADNQFLAKYSKGKLDSTYPLGLTSHINGAYESTEETRNPAIINGNQESSPIPIVAKKEQKTGSSVRGTPIGYKGVLVAT